VGGELGAYFRVMMTVFVVDLVPVLESAWNFTVFFPFPSGRTVAVHLPPFTGAVLGGLEPSFHWTEVAFDAVP
jgi:hypothetical protein